MSRSPTSHPSWADDDVLTANKTIQPELPTVEGKSWRWNSVPDEDVHILTFGSPEGIIRQHQTKKGNPLPPPHPSWKIAPQLKMTVSVCDSTGSVILSVVFFNGLIRDVKIVSLWCQFGWAALHFYSYSYTVRLHVLFDKMTVTCLFNYVY